MHRIKYSLNIYTQWVAIFAETEDLQIVIIVIRKFARSMLFLLKIYLLIFARVATLHIKMALKMF
ncbi:MAG: hypothetical protein DRN11_00305 [Thermoplasmata archaeon]|nr:MAG: hypothetical protein DRN11_00305 [Thermoplasmata archaeon]